MLKKTILFVFMFALVLNVSAAMAETYQLQVDLGYEASKDDPKTDAETKNNYLNLSATFNFEQVSLDNRPYEEAAFLQRTGSVRVMGSLLKSEQGSLEDDGKMFGAAIDYVFKPLPLYLGFDYLRKELEGDIQDTNYEMTTNSFTGKVGAHLGESFRIYAGYERYDADYKVSGGDAEMKENNFLVSFKLVQALDSQMSINVEGTVKRIAKEIKPGNTKEKNTETEILADLYIMPQFGIGAGFEINSGEDKESEGNTYSFRAKYYFIPNAALSVSYDMFKAKDTNEGDDSNTLAIGFTGRF